MVLIIKMWGLNMPNKHAQSIGQPLLLFHPFYYALLFSSHCFFASLVLTGGSFCFIYLHHIYYIFIYTQ